VEDDAPTRHALARALRAAGHTCRDVENVEQALRALRRKRADVILCDWELPGSSGLELCRRTRVTGDGSRYVYVILMTGHDDGGRLRAAMEAGADDYQKKPVSLDELDARLVLASRVLALHRRLGDQTARLRRDSQRLYLASHTDALTGIGNRLALEEELDAVRSQYARYGRRVSVAVCDVDLFKQYNDRFGHIAGDEALRRIAQALKEHLRASDRVFRYGGEEFVVVLPEQGLEEASFAIDRLRQEVERLGIEAPSGSPAGVLTMSAGVAELGASDARGEDWIGRADRALYRAKANGRNRVEMQGP
jgi:two-component system, cell cycle response regulator